MQSALGKMCFPQTLLLSGENMSLKNKQLVFGFAQLKSFFFLSLNFFFIYLII